VSRQTPLAATRGVGFPSGMRLSALAITVGLGATVVGCGGHAPAGRTTAGAPPSGGAIWCPTSSRATESKQSKANWPTSRGSFDTRTLLGLTETQSARKAARWRCSLRVIQRNGKKFLLTADFSSNRVNVVIAHNRVTSVGVY
jgi:hypothetical protein